MVFSLIICTYNRPIALLNLLNSIEKQSLAPNEILIIDASENASLFEEIKKLNLLNLQYYKVEEKYRGLTKQRNYGISKLRKDAEIVCFLDDDIILEQNYFEILISSYQILKDAIAVGGWIKNETEWKRVPENYEPRFKEFKYDGYVRNLGRRNVLRKNLGLLSNARPGFMPKFSHGFSTGFLPPSGKTYPVEYFMGGVSSYRTELFKTIKFSSYFEGYGLYEDMDFCLRASRIGNLYVNTAAQVVHLHEESGRPDNLKFGKMVIENGYYVWKLKYPNPDFYSRIKYFSIDLILIFLRFFNGLNKEKSGIPDAKGRCLGLWNLLVKRNKRTIK